MNKSLFGKVAKSNSDEIDKLFGVWNDIFLDTVDLHGYFPRQNLYGPVAFKIRTEFMLNKDYDIWITKDNPINWNREDANKERYFENVRELRDNWDNYQRQWKMVTIKNQNNPILFDYVEEVIVDDPRVKKGDTIYFNECVRILKEALLVNPPLKNRFKTRQCNNCFCRNTHKASYGQHLTSHPPTDILKNNKYDLSSLR